MFLANFIPNPVLVNVGPIEIRWYGLVLALAVTGGFLVFRKLSRMDKDKAFSLFFWVLLAAILGGRLIHVLTFLKYYISNPWYVFAIWNGGIAFYGVFIFGMGTLLYLTKSKFLKLMDTVVVGLALAQSIGRFGNWFNGELFGKPCELFWCIPVEYYKRPIEYFNFSHFHPTFLYESLLMMLVFVVLWFAYKKVERKDGGFIFSIYLILHGLVRFVMELFRVDVQAQLLGLRTFGWVAIIEILIGIALLVLLKSGKIYVHGKRN